MFARTIAAAAVLMLFAAPANAFYCPNQGKAIDHALSTASLSADQKAEVKKLRDEGMALHGSGDHKGAVKSLAGATRIILNAM
ncbi:MAG: hypothetical protein IIB67_02480 [Proteobacteria bacterium]|nr:hypothetical protein [Pseudomonadota bacterium]